MQTNEVFFSMYAKSEWMSSFSLFYLRIKNNKSREYKAKFRGEQKEKTKWASKQDLVHFECISMERAKLTIFHVFYFANWWVTMSQMVDPFLMMFPFGRIIEMKQKHSIDVIEHLHVIIKRTAVRWTICHSLNKSLGCCTGEWLLSVKICPTNSWLSSTGFFVFFVSFRFVSEKMQKLQNLVCVCWIRNYGCDIYSMCMHIYRLSIEILMKYNI